MMENTIKDKEVKNFSRRRILTGLGIAGVALIGASLARRLELTQDVELTPWEKKLFEQHTNDSQESIHKLIKNSFLQKYPPKFNPQLTSDDLEVSRNRAKNTGGYFPFSSTVALGEKDASLNLAIENMYDKEGNLFWTRLTTNLLQSSLPEIRKYTHGKKEVSPEELRGALQEIFNLPPVLYWNPKEATRVPILEGKEKLKEGTLLTVTATAFGDVTFEINQNLAQFIQEKPQIK